MINLAAYLGALVLVVMAILVTMLALHAIQLLANQRAAWPYRVKIAHLAHLVTKDADAPGEVRWIVNQMADRAFDREFFQFIRSTPPAVPDQEPYSARIHREYGEHYGLVIGELIVALTFVVLFSDRRQGTLYRQVRRGIIMKRNAEKIRELRENQIKPLREKVNRNFSQAPDLQAA